jgi:anti-sigma B factor antagonist
MAFQISLANDGPAALLTLVGELDASTAPLFREEIEKAAAVKPQKLVLILKDLEYIASAGLRVLIFARQKMGSEVEIYIIAPQDQVLDTLEKTGFQHSVIIQDMYPN